MTRWLVAAAMWVLAGAADAHPHVWITVSSEIHYDAAGEPLLIRHHWIFDEAYSSFIVLGLDKNRDGNLTEEELRNTSVINVPLLEQARFFTFCSNAAGSVDLLAARDFRLEYVGRRVGLFFDLYLRAPAESKSGLTVRIYDPTFFVSLTLSGAKDAIKVVNLPDQCTFGVTRPESIIDAQRIIPDAIFLARDGNQTYGEKFANEAKIKCS